MIRSFVASLLVACGDDIPPPSCASLDAGATLACNTGGLCTWQGQECCAEPVPGRSRDSRCEVK